MIVGVPDCVYHNYIGAYHDVIIMYYPLIVKNMLIRSIVIHMNYVVLIIVTIPANLPRRPFLREETSDIYVPDPHDITTVRCLTGV